MAEPRFTLEPLERYLETTDSAETATVLDLPKRTVQRYRQFGLSLVQADRLAIRAGIHPCLIWGTAWWVGTEDGA